MIRPRTLMNLYAKLFVTHTMSNCLPRITLIFALALAIQADAQTNTLFPRNRVHDPSTVIGCDGEFWTYATGDGIKTWHSTNLTDWFAAKPAFPTNPAWASSVAAVHRDYFWAPDIISVHGRYFLYYSVSSWGKNTSAIGLATNSTLNPDDVKYFWQDQGIVVRSYSTNEFNTIDPAAILDVDGRLWLVFGSYWRGIKLIELDPKTGLRITPDSPMYSLAHHDSIEASYIYRHGTNYFLFVNWGQCCQGTNSTYEIRIGRSDKITGPYLDRNGKDLLQQGGTVFLESKPPFYGPGHAGIISVRGQDWFSCHYYDGNERGRARLWTGKLNWGTDGWPIPPTLDHSIRLNGQ